MTHDFAKKPKPTGKKKPSKKEAQVPGWAWLLTGIVLGIFICFLGYLAGVTPEPNPDEGEAAIKPKASKTQKPNDKEKSPASTTRFDFYTLLPEREVIVPEQQHGDTTGEAEHATIYILQAGSFKSAADADRLRARLILMGLEAKVDKVTVASGELWYRVQVGPFTSRSKLSKARSTLISENIDTLLLKRKT